MQQFGISSLRTAQHHAKHGHPQWVEFLAVYGASALKQEKPVIEQAQALVVTLEDAKERGLGQAHIAPPAMSKPRELWSPEEYAECEAWNALVLANEQRDKALRSSDAMNAVGFVGIASNALKTYHLARREREKAEIAAGRLKPISAWVSVKSSIMKIAGLIKAFPSVASAANPDHPHVARQAITNYMHEVFDPQVAAFIDELEREMAV